MEVFIYIDINFMMLHYLVTKIHRRCVGNSKLHSMLSCMFTLEGRQISVYGGFSYPMIRLAIRKLNVSVSFRYSIMKIVVIKSV